MNSPTDSSRLRPAKLFLVLSAFVTFSCNAADRANDSSLSGSLTFHASFDEGTDADYAAGDKRLYTCLRPANQSEARPGLHTDEQTLHLATGGLSGGALKFTARNAKWLFFQGEDNVAFNQNQWSGTVSVWLSLDPEEDLDPGFTDPIQITPRKWNDAAFFVDFNKDGDPRDFRLGAFADLAIWNAKNQNVNDIPEDQRPLAKVTAPPFERGKWTHVVFSWEHFNTGQEDGIARLYLDGELRGEIKGWNQQFSWSATEDLRLFIGLNYIGLFDELSCYNRALAAGEVQTLYQLQGDVKKLIPRP